MLINLFRLVLVDKFRAMLTSSVASRTCYYNAVFLSVSYIKIMVLNICDVELKCSFYLSNIIRTVVKSTKHFLRYY